MPFSTEVHTSSALSTVASAYTNGDLIADAMCPIIPSMKRQDVYYNYNRTDASTIRDDLIGPDSEASRSTFTLATTTFTVVDRGLKDVVSNDTIANADAPIQPLIDATDNLMLRLMLSRELRVATLVLTTGNYLAANTSAAGNAWNDETNGTPLADFQTMIEAIAPGETGDTKLVAGMSIEAWNVLRKHPQLRGGGQVNPVLDRAEAAARLGVDEIMVSNTMQNTAAEGQTAVYARIWTVGSVSLLRLPRSAPRGKQSLFCGTFRFSPPGSEGVSVRQWDEPKFGPRGSQAIQVSFSDDERVIQNDNGYLLTGAAT